MPYRRTLRRAVGCTGIGLHSGKPVRLELKPAPAEHGIRFLHGTPSVPALYAAQAGYEIVTAAGVDAIRAKSMRQVQLLVDLARERGFRPHAPERPEQRGGMVILDVPHAQAVTRELLRREVIVDFRPGAGIRFSPHFYTTDDEIRRAMEETRQILDSGAYRAPHTEFSCPIEGRCGEPSDAPASVSIPASRCVSS